MDFMNNFSLVLFTNILITILVKGQEVSKEWISPNVSVCFTADSVKLDFIYNPPNKDKSFALVTWHRKVNSGSGEEGIAQLLGDVFTLKALPDRLNRSGEFGLVLSKPTTGDAGEYSIKLRTKDGGSKIGKFTLFVNDPCIEKVEDVNKCWKVTCKSSVSNAAYTWMGPSDNYTAETIDVCPGKAGNYKCCVSNGGCASAQVSPQPSTGDGVTVADTTGEVFWGINITEITTINTNQGLGTDPPNSQTHIYVGVAVGLGVVAIIVAVIVAVVLVRKKRSEKSDYKPTATAEAV